MTRRRTVRILAQRDGWECHYCGDVLDLCSAQVEHWLPRSRGGNDRPSNLVLACRSCNLSKRARAPWEWLGVDCCEAHRILREVGERIGAL